MEAFRIKFHSGKKGKSFILKKRPTWEMCKADPKKPAQGAFSTDAVLALRPLCGLNGGGRSNTAAPSPFPLFSQSSDFVYPFWPIQASTSSLFCKVAFFEVPYHSDNLFFFATSWRLFLILLASDFGAKVARWLNNSLGFDVILRGLTFLITLLILELRQKLIWWDQKRRTFRSLLSASLIFCWLQFVVSQQCCQMKVSNSGPKLSESGQFNQKFLSWTFKDLQFGILTILIIISIWHR